MLRQCGKVEIAFAVKSIWEVLGKLSIYQYKERRET